MLRPEPEQFETIEQYCASLIEWNAKMAGGSPLTDDEIRAKYEQVRKLGPVRFEPFTNEPKDIKDADT